MSGESEEAPVDEPNLRVFATTAMVVGLFGSLLIGFVGIVSVSILVRPQDPVSAMAADSGVFVAGSVAAPDLLHEQLKSQSTFDPVRAAPFYQPARVTAPSRRLRIEITNGEDGKGSRSQLILDGEPLGEASDGEELQLALSKLKQRLHNSSRGRDLELCVPRGVNSRLLSRVVDTLLAAEVSFEVLNRDLKSSR